MAKPRIVNSLVFLLNLVLVIAVIICLAIWYKWEEVPDLNQVLKYVDADVTAELSNNERVYLVSPDLAKLYSPMSDSARPVGQPTEPVWAWLTDRNADVAFTFDYEPAAAWRIEDVEQAEDGTVKAHIVDADSGEHLTWREDRLQFTGSAAPPEDTLWTLTPITSQKGSPQATTTNPDDKKGESDTSDVPKIMTHSLAVSDTFILAEKPDSEQKSQQTGTRIRILQQPEEDPAMCQISQGDRFLSIHKDKDGSIRMTCLPSDAGKPGRWLLIRTR